MNNPIKSVLIESVNPVIPTKGSNQGKQMFIINGQYWSKNEPSRSDTHVCLQDVEGETKSGEKATFTNVVGFKADTRMSIGEKISTLTGVDAAYSMAVATLLR